MTVQQGVEIESIAAGGNGLAHVDGVVAFVPRTTPGDRITVRLSTRAGGRFSRGEMMKLEEHAGPDRVEAPCLHYTHDRCGGCQLQHVRYDAQLRAKGTIVRDAITRIAKRSIDLVPVEASPRHWRYRTKLTLAFRRHDTKWIAGLHRYDAPHEVFALDDCPITDERITMTWRDVMRASADLPRGDQLRGSIRAVGAGLAFVLEGGTQWPRREQFRAAVPALTEVWWSPMGRVRQQITPRETLATGASFAQVNEDVAAALHTYVIERALAYQPTSLIDAYAGTGATARPLAHQGVQVTAIESDRDAAMALVSTLPSPSRVLHARVEDALASVLPADVVLVNPPRVGLAVEVSQMLSHATVNAIIYVSCDPATLARDLARLPQFRIASMRAFDMFPQTAHVETVCELVPDPAPA